MGLVDILLCIFLPPFASGVRVRGCGMMLLVLLLCCVFWLPGCVAAFYMTLNKPPNQPIINIYNQQPPPSQ